MQLFSKHDGLCSGVNLMYPNDPAVKRAYSAVEIEIIDQFDNAGLNKGYPFGMDAFDRRAATGTQHLCPLRRAWVEDHIHNPPTNQSQKLTDFYKAWWKWANETK